MKQPIFYPGKKLRAEDLINLEDYAFSRTNIISQDHGVVSLFNNGSTPESTQENDPCYFLISEVTGITPAGRPVDFKADAKRVRLKLAYSVDRGSALIMDIYIEDLHPQNTGQVKDNEEKYSLYGIEIKDSDITAPAIDSNKLYLGRYKLTKERKPEIISPPLMFSLSAFNFPSKEWQKWTFPIREALRKVVEGKTNDNIDSFVRHIVYNYPFWPLSTLFRSCRELKWFCDDKDLNILLDETVMLELQENLVINPLPKALEKINPKDIPEEISKILGRGDIHNTWKRLPDTEFKKTSSELIINKVFKGDHVIKFQFEKEMEAYERLVVDSFYHFDVAVLKEFDNNNRDCYNYIIDYPGAIQDEPFKMLLPDLWTDTKFKIYYRSIHQNQLT